MLTPPLPGLFISANAYTINSPLVVAMSIVAGMPERMNDRAAIIEKAKDQRHCLLSKASIPPTIATKAITTAGMGIYFFSKLS
jgi:hypothetical protein